MSKFSYETNEESFSRTFEHFHKDRRDKNMTAGVAVRQYSASTMLGCNSRVSFKKCICLLQVKSMEELASCFPPAQELRSSMPRNSQYATCNKRALVDLTAPHCCLKMAGSRYASAKIIVWVMMQNKPSFCHSLAIRLNGSLNAPSTLVYIR